MSKIYVDEIAGIASPSTVAIPGHVIQVANHKWSTADTITSSSFADVSNSSFTFTPKSASSELLIICDVHFRIYNTEAFSGGSFRINVDGTAIDSPSADYESYYYSGEVEANLYSRYPKVALISNTSTAAKTIKLQARIFATTDNVIFNYQNNFTSSITVQEIAG